MIILLKIKAKFVKKVGSFAKLYYDPTKSKIKKKNRGNYSVFATPTDGAREQSAWVYDVTDRLIPFPPLSGRHCRF